MKIALVGCVKSKHIKACLAKNLYNSSLFIKTKTLIELKNDYSDWFILSAKYGLINKEEIIEPYELTLSNFTQNELSDWSFKIFNSIKLLELNNLSFFCGKLYHNKYLLSLLDKEKIQYNFPMGNLSIGKRLQFLTNEIRRITNEKSNHRIIRGYGLDDPLRPLLK